MKNIRIEANYYSCVREYVVMVLYIDDNNESASICYYPNGKRAALKQMVTLEKQYNTKGVLNV